MLVLSWILLFSLHAYNLVDFFVTGYHLILIKYYYNNYCKYMYVYLWPCSPYKCFWADILEKSLNLVIDLDARVANENNLWKMNVSPIFNCRGNSHPRNVNIVTVYDIQNKFIGEQISWWFCKALFVPFNLSFPFRWEANITLMYMSNVDR